MSKHSLKAPILITGAPGNVGTEVVRELQALNISFRVAARDPEQARKILGSDVEIVSFDFLNPDTYEAAFDGIEHVFLVRPPTLSNVQRDIAPAIRAAVASGVKHIVFLSIQGVEQNPVVPHYKIEQFILQTGVHYTFLRASFFMQNLATAHVAEIRDDNEIVLPVGKAKTSFIDVRDIAAVAVRALTEKEYQDKKYTLTGSEALDYDQIAEKLSAALQRRIRYANPSIFTFVRRQIMQGQKLVYVLIMTALYTITRFGNAKDVTHDVQLILGRSPILFDQFAKDYRNCWHRTDVPDTVKPVLDATR